LVADQLLVDHHCHGVLTRDADEAALESMLTEGSSWLGGSVFDSGAGFAFRRLCPPVLDLPPHAELADYLARRAELGATEVSKRFLSAAGRWLAAGAGRAGGTGPPRLAEPTLQRFLIWCGVELGLPVQFHVGYGDSDVDLHRCNPLLLTPLLRAIEPTGVPVMLLHNYPFHREAGYLAQVFGHVYVDAGLATHNLGARAPALLAEALELAPYGKFLYSSDAFGLPELYYLGATLFRQGLSGFLQAGLDDDLYDERTAARLARMICADNAKRAYRLGEQM
jgi:hypothetical protein